MSYRLVAVVAITYRTSSVDLHILKLLNDGYTVEGGGEWPGKPSPLPKIGARESHFIQKIFFIFFIW